MEKNLSVAVVELVGGHGGMNTYDTGLCKGLVAAGLRVSLYTCDETTDLGVPGLHFCPIYKGIYGKSHPLLRAFRFFLGNLAVLWNTFKRHERVVHFHVFQGGALELAFVLMAKGWWRKVVLTVHDVESLARPSMEGKTPSNLVYRLADSLIVHNQTSKRELIDRLGLDAARIHVIPIGNYLDTIANVPASAEAKRSLDIGETKKVVLFFGQIKEVKGLDLLIQAMPTVIREVPDAWLVIAGRPWKTDFSRYDQLIDQLGIRGRCQTNIGYVSDEDVARYYAAADLVVLPYRRIYQSGVLLLAMSYARAVVASDLPGMTEIVTDGENGYIFARESADSLAQTLVRALKDDQKRNAISKYALEYVQVHHDWSSIGTATAEVYEKLVH